MKKKFLSLLTALCLMLSLAPAAFAVDATTANNPTTVSTEAELIAAVSSTATYDVVALGTNITLSAPLAVEHAVVIDGGEDNQYSITAPSGKNVINVTAAGVTLQNLTINASGSGYGINSTASGLTVANCAINVTERGINFYPTNGSEATLSVSGTTIKNTAVSDYDTSVNYSGENRGISTGNVKGGTVTIADSNIYGFKYSINVVVSPDSSKNNLRDGDGTQFVVSNTFVKGWTALNVWSANTDFEFTNCSLVGINTLSGSSNAYSTVNVNNGIYGGYTDKNCYISIIGGAVTAVKYGGAAQCDFGVESELQTMFSFAKYSQSSVWVKYFGPENVAGASTRYVYMWNFDPDSDADGRGSYMVDMVTGEDENVSLSGGTLEEYATEVSAAAESGEPSVEYTLSSGHVGGSY